MVSTSHSSPVWDLSLVPEADLQFLVITDTHYILPNNAQSTEWQAVSEFTERTTRALRLASGLPHDFAVHLGDISHEYPETGRAEVAQSAALDQFAAHALQFHQAAGNMDIGDKPDPTSPAGWVTTQTLTGWHERCGRSWHSFDAGDLHGIVLNTQIMNGPLPEAAEQMAWTEADLAASSAKRLLLFLHMPIYYVHRHEHATGFYNSLDEPARSWLLGLIETFGVEFVFTGHTHTIQRNQHGRCRLWTAPSTATSRSGLAEAYALIPPDRGRGDIDKLGFYFVRETKHGTSVHLVRTGRETPTIADSTTARLVMTRTPRDLPGGRFGVFATHPLGHANPGPVIWPSIVRQPVRDDFRLASILEVGASFVRVPASDLSTPGESGRLEVLRDEGVQINPSWIWNDWFDLVARVRASAHCIDGVEVVLPGRLEPPVSLLDEIRSVREMKLPVTLSPAIVEASGQSQYHQRTRVGYWPSELDMLNTFLGQQNLGVDRVGCRLSTLHPASQIEAAAEIELDRIGGIDWYLDFVSEDDSHNARVIAEALGSIARHPPMRLVVGPHVDLDRSMDVAHGLIDRLSNPRSPLVVARMLSSLLFEISDVDVILPGMDPVDPGENRVYVLPGAEDGSQSLPQSMSGMFDEGRSATVYALELALSWEVTSSAQAAEILTGIIGPAAICIGTRAATA